MKLAKGTPHWVLAAALAAVAAVALAVWASPWWWALAIPAALLAVALLNFFRDPDRAIADGIVSPADGRVIGVLDDGGRKRVNVFMNPLDVHVNRAPYDARVVSVRHVPGGFVPAFRKESERNERVVMDLDTPLGPMTTIHIAGTVARRIVPYVRTGDALRKGDRTGIIRLGSRVDVYMPGDVEVQVKVGDRVLAGATTLARPRREDRP